MVISISGILKDFFNLFVPSKCLHCGINLLEHENYICKSCIYKIPKTNFYKDPQNVVSQIFWGRTELAHAFAHYYFAKGSILQGLVHKIKYQGEKELAFELGKEMAFDLKDTEFNYNVDLIVPVPLHPKKEKKRGYNQSDWIAKGFAEVLGIECNKNVLKRVVYTSTQTKKNREQRWENVKDAFEIGNAKLLKNKHIVIVDDVLTTGATLEACANKLNQISGVKVSVVTLAYASD